MSQLYLIAISLLVALAVAAALTPNFHDSMTQCAGLGLIAVGGAAEAANLYLTHNGAPRAHLLLVLGCAIYGLGSMLKHWQQRRKS